jgi:signal transduction histidine kinase
LIYRFYWGENYAVVTAGLFWTFNLFAIITMSTSIREKKARLDAQQINVDLQSAQQLLTQATKQAERTRIARNIHDLLGHHLSATLHAITKHIKPLNVALHVDNTLEFDDFSTAESIVRIVQEAISNTLKHSQATTMHIHVGHIDEMLHIHIKDNGQYQRHWQEGNGLTGIRERVELMGGSTDIKATSDGFSISIEVRLTHHD